MNRSTWEFMLSFIPFGWSMFLKVSIWEFNCYKWEGSRYKDKGVILKILKLETLYSW